MSTATASSPDNLEAGTLVRVLRVLRDRWWVIGLVALVCMAAAYVSSKAATERYEASSQLMFTAAVENSVFDINITQPDADRDAATIFNLVKSEAVARRVRRRLGLRTPAEDLAEKIEITEEGNADVALITATDSDPRLAARLANSFAAQYVAFRGQDNRRKIVAATRQLRNRLQSVPTSSPERPGLALELEKLAAARGADVSGARVLERATVPTNATSPRPRRDAAIGLALGVVLGLGIAFLLEALDRRLKSVEELERIYGLPALATIPRGALRAAGPSEDFRILQSGIGSLRAPGEVRVLVVTSAIDGEGRTTVAANLARAIATSERDVALVEADLRRPSLGRHFPLARAPVGLTTALVGRQPVRELLQSVSPNLSLLPSGPLQADSGTLLQGPRMGELLEELSSDRLVIVDAPALLPVADARSLLNHSAVEACLIVGRAYKTRADEARRARAVIDQHPRISFGLVVTDAQRAGGHRFVASLTDRLSATVLSSPDGAREEQRSSLDPTR